VRNAASNESPRLRSSSRSAGSRLSPIHAPTTGPAVPQAQWRFSSLGERLPFAYSDRPDDRPIALPHRPPLSTNRGLRHKGVIGAVCDDHHGDALLPVLMAQSPGNRSRVGSSSAAR
jgi:hypothetical protein